MSPRGLLLSAAALLALRCALWALGLDAWVSVISGTAPPGGVSIEAAAAVALLVVLAHLGAVLVAPPLAIGAVILAALGRVARR